jgi:hypothetical protein
MPQAPYGDNLKKWMSLNGRDMYDCNSQPHLEGARIFLNLTFTKHHSYELFFYWNSHYCSDGGQMLQAPYAGTLKNGYLRMEATWTIVIHSPA